MASRSLSRVPIREDDRFDWQANGEARHVGVRLDCGIRLENVYVPAGGDIPDREQSIPSSARSSTSSSG